MTQSNRVIHSGIATLGEEYRDVSEAIVDEYLATKGTTNQHAMLQQKDSLVDSVLHSIKAGRMRADDLVRFDYLEQQYKGVGNSDVIIAKELGFKSGAYYRRMRGAVRLNPEPRKEFDRKFLPSMDKDAFPGPILSGYYSLVEVMHGVQSEFLKRPSERLEIEWMISLLAIWSRPKLKEHLKESASPDVFQALEELIQHVRDSPYSRRDWKVLSKYHLPHVHAEWYDAMSISLWARDELRVRGEIENP